MVLGIFAEDAGLLPGNMFTGIPQRASRLFGAMAAGGDAGFGPVAWFDGDTALPPDREEIDPSIPGTLSERRLDPDKRSQPGSHDTDRDKIMRIIDPVTGDLFRGPVDVIRYAIPHTTTLSRRGRSGTTAATAGNIDHSAMSRVRNDAHRVSAVQESTVPVLLTSPVFRVTMASPRPSSTIESRKAATPGLGRDRIISGTTFVSSTISGQTYSEPILPSSDHAGSCALM